MKRSSGFFSRIVDPSKNAGYSKLWFTKALCDETNRVCHSYTDHGYCVHASKEQCKVLLNVIKPGNYDVITARFILCHAIIQIVMN